MAAAIELASGLHERLIERLDLRRTDINRMTDAELWTYAQRHLQQLIDQSEARHSPERGLLERQILQEVLQSSGPRQSCHSLFLRSPVRIRERCPLLARCFASAC